MTFLDEAYWAQWAPAAHQRYRNSMDALVPTPRPLRYFRWAPAGPVPAWLREETDGKLSAPEAPTLNVVRCWARVDWPTLVEQHRDELVMAGATGPVGPSWDRVCRAWSALESAGHRPVLDVDLEVSVGGVMLEIRHGGIGTTSGRLVTDVEWRAATAIGDQCEVYWPASDLSRISSYDGQSGSSRFLSRQAKGSPTSAGSGRAWRSGRESGNPPYTWGGR